VYFIVKQLVKTGQNGYGLKNKIKEMVENLLKGVTCLVGQIWGNTGEV
jgi:hypothetical protein